VNDLPIEILAMDHVAIATWDVTTLVHLLTKVLGAEYVDGGDDTNTGFRWLQFRLPGGKVEVLEPLDREGFLYRFLTKRGEGLHHVTFYVRDLADAVPRLTAAGYDPVDVNLEHASWKEAFLHPRDTSGVLIQLAETPVPEGASAPSLDEVLADRPDLRPD
jgi:methylmalonyl-CoA epimerase